MNLKLDEMLGIDLVEIMSIGAALSAFAAVTWTMKHELVQKTVASGVDLLEDQINRKREADLKRAELLANLTEEMIKQSPEIISKITENTAVQAEILEKVVAGVLTGGTSTIVPAITNENIGAPG